MSAPKTAPGESWPLTDAKARFSELFEKALSEGPQRVTRHGKRAVVVVSEQLYRVLSRRKREQKLADFLASSPLKGLDLDFSREPDIEREVDL
jgi:prevent-host-death family protein